MTPIVKFKVNAEKELEYFDKFVKFCGTSKLKEESLQLLNMNKNGAVKRLKEDYKQKEFIDFINNLKKEWKLIEKEYFRKVEEMTGFKWQHDKYTCYLSLNVPGFADPKNKNFNQVIISNILSVSIMKYVLAHELFHLHNYYILSKNKEILPNEAGSTIILESIPLLYLVVDPKLNKLWKDIRLDRVRNSYPEVNRIIDKLIEVYKNEKDFIKLMKKAIEINRSK